MKADAVLSKESKQYLINYIKNGPRAVLQYKNPFDHFYNKTGHREYLSKFIESFIIRLLRDKGHDPIKAMDKGQRVDNRKRVKIGNAWRQIGSVEYRKSNHVKKGRADVVCFFNGQYWNMEVKVGRDRMSEAQKQEKERAESKGERYVIIKTVDDFLDIFEPDWKKKLDF
jgi:hypothetical protein